MKTAALFLAIGVAMMVGLYAGGALQPVLAGNDSADSAPDTGYGRAAWASYADGVDDATGSNWVQTDYARMAAAADDAAQAAVEPERVAAPAPAPASLHPKPAVHETPAASPAPSIDIRAGLRSYAPPVSLDAAPPEPPSPT
jgi:hypothetical protein